MTRPSKRFERLAAYVPLVATACILIIQTFFPTFLEDFGTNLALATMTVAFILVAWHLESRVESFRETIKRLQSTIDQFVEDQPRIVADATANFRRMSLGDAFAKAVELAPRVDHLRIYAATGSQMHTFIEHARVRIDRCSLLVQRSHGNPALAAIIETALDRWRLLVTRGKIEQLEILRYDFQPTEYKCIFDRKVLIYGLFDPSPNEDSGVAVRDPMLATDQSLSGAAFVEEYVERFDRLFAHCRQYYGANDPVTVFRHEPKVPESRVSTRFE